MDSVGCDASHYCPDKRREPNTLSTGRVTTISEWTPLFPLPSIVICRRTTSQRYDVPELPCPQ